MKMNIKKVATILGSALMLGATAGMAAAASFTPSSFSDSGVAIVVGANAANSDLKAAVDLTTNLAGDLAKTTVSTSSSATVSGGDSYKLEKSSTKFHLGDSAIAVVSSTVTDTNLPVLLADGVYTDKESSDFDYTQKVTLGRNINVTQFVDSDFKAKTPTLGIRIPNGANVLNYTLDFTDQPEWADLVTSNLPILGKSYYVLANGTAGVSLTLLDSANSLVVAEGETSTVTVGEKSYEVSINYVGDTSVKLSINGQTTNSLREGATQKLSDGSYVGIKDIMYSAKDSGVSKVELSIGKGKLLVSNNSEVELNDDTISGLTGAIGMSGSKLDTITLAWNTEDDMFATADSGITMPGFEAIKLSFGGLNNPAEEASVVDVDGGDSIILKDFALMDTTETINVLYSNGTNYTVVGKDAENKLVTSGNGTLIFDGDTDTWFVASWNDTKDSESYLLRATDWKNESGSQKVTIQARKDGSWKDVQVDAQAGDVISIGSVEFTLASSVKADKTVRLTADASTKFDRIYSKEGMRVLLPWISTAAFNQSAVNMTGITAAAACAAVPIVPGQLGVSGITVTYNASVGGLTGVNTTTCTSLLATYNLVFSEESKDDTLAAGKTINVTLGLTTDTNVKVSNVAINGTNSDLSELQDTDTWQQYAYSSLATKLVWDKSGDQDAPVKLTYHGSEVTADVYLTAPSATVSAGAGSTTGTTQVGAVTVYDNEVSSVSGKNLIVIGGSCINSVAAELLGGAACDAAFTAKANVKAGEALIKSFKRGDKIALLVAGYNAEDTTKAVTYLSNKPINTTVGAALKVIAADSATAITA
ncbi:MAG: hypothetical protein WCI72_05525 [archaeon]